MRTWTLVVLALLLAVPAAGALAQGKENPHGANIGACANCHSPNAWKPARVSRAFKHAEKTFPLDGAHARTTCLACHKSLDFSKVQSACSSCHSDVHKGELGVQCARCHTSRSFTDQGQLRRMHELTQLPLRGAHASLTCDACHTPTASGQAQYVGRPAACYACHSAEYRSAKDPDHAAEGFSTECGACHNSANWLNATFDHSTTPFPLTGAHQTVACVSCHGDNVYVGKSTACVSCHQKDYSGALLPPHQSLGFPTVCATCHTTTAWQGGSFDHNTTNFKLTGAHQAVACSACHSDGVYRGKPTACAGCHQANYAATTTPPHAPSGISTTCENCHGTVAWTGAKFDHSATLFPLTGLHVTASCASCHGDGVYKGKSTACASCHQAIYTTTTTPPHAAAGFPITCETCHSTSSWMTATFNHANTLFPLTGLHMTTPCAACHGDGVYKGKSILCFSCHQSSYAATTTPAHAAAGFPTTCETCHSTSSWLTATFNHANTSFPLTGLHATTPCASCHGDGVYKGKSTVCASCHQSSYTATTNPPHAASGFPLTCETCHSTSSWLTATFNHNTTLFPLTGLHATTPCTACHGDGVYKGKSTLCYSCHQSSYAATTTPPHAVAGFATTCETCHSTSSWLTATFNHSTTLFPLTGGHLTVPCSGCHGDGVYKGKSTLCASCHQALYTATTTPPHAASGFPLTCETCHTTASWLTATFNHNTTLFPLTGLHATTPCASCHGDGVYKGKSTLCYSCHQSSYTATTNPPHAAAGFATTCETCHSTSSWLTAVFNHATTKFPLTGVHATTPCLSCHGDGVYVGKSTLCSSCHMTDYNGTNNPAHAAAGFPTTCDQCHTTSTWLGATFNHDASFFPIYSGRHKGVWSACTDCHTSPTNYAVFSCFQCHAQATTNSHHSGVSGYSYDSNRCYACHPKGTSG